MRWAPRGAKVKGVSPRMLWIVLLTVATSFTGASANMFTLSPPFQHTSLVLGDIGGILEPLDKTVTAQSCRHSACGDPWHGQMTSVGESMTATLARDWAHLGANNGQSHKSLIALSVRPL